MLLGLQIIFMVGHDPNSNYLMKINKQKCFEINNYSLPSPKTKISPYGFDIPCKELSRTVLPHFKIISH